MPASIPFDSSLALGSVVDPLKLEQLERVLRRKAIVSEAEVELEAAIASVRVLERTRLDVGAMNIGSTGKMLHEASLAAEQRVESATKRLVEARIKQEKEINLILCKLRHIGVEYESPVDLARTQIRQMPLASDSIQMTVQYFPFVQKESKDVADRLASYVSHSMSFLGAKRSIDIGSVVKSHVAEQHSIFCTEGTLIITATCTHRNATLLSPIILDPDAALRLWNTMFSSNRIPVYDSESIACIAREDPTENDKALTLCSGAAYGSSFIGMVHVLSAKDITLLPKQMGQSSALSDVKRLLSSPQLASSHCSVVTTGVIPSVKSDIKIDNSQEIPTILSSLSLTSAFEDYISNVLAGQIGVPIKFYLKSFHREEIAQIWCDKYMPEWRRMSFGSDSTHSTPDQSMESVAATALDSLSSE